MWISSTTAYLSLVCVVVMLVLQKQATFTDDLIKRSVDGYIKSITKSYWHVFSWYMNKMLSLSFLLSKKSRKCSLLSLSWDGIPNNFFLLEIWSNEELAHTDCGICKEAKVGNGVEYFLEFWVLRGLIIWLIGIDAGKLIKLVTLDRATLLLILLLFVICEQIVDIQAELSESIGYVLILPRRLCFG